jgi:hypothetical protein
VCVRVSVCTLTTSSCSPDGALCGFLWQPNLRALESLTLRAVEFGLPGDVTRPMETEYGAAFSSLPSLHTLTLRSATVVDYLLPHLASSPSLRVLRVGSHLWIGITSGGFDPTVEILMSLFDAATLLHVVFYLSALVDQDKSYESHERFIERQQRYEAAIATYKTLAPLVEIHIVQPGGHN